MNAAESILAPDSGSNGRHLDISPRRFVDSYSELGFERKLTHAGSVFVHHDERIIVPPVMTEIGSIDRWHTIRRLEDTLETHRAKRRGQRVLAVFVLLLAAMLMALAWPHAVSAETRQGALEAAYEDVDTAAPLATCALPYTLGPHETTVLQCTHRLRGLAVVEKYRSGHNRVLISPSATVNRGDAVLIVVHNTGDKTAAGTAYAEFW